MGLQNGNDTLSYTDFSFMPKIPIKLIQYLATNESQEAEGLWKLLKYDTTDAISKPNLILEEKMALVWSPDKEDSSLENLFRVFLKPLTPSSLNTSEEHNQLRISRYMTKPNDNIKSTIAYQFILTTSEKMSLVYDKDNDLVERTDLMESYLLALFNGRDIEIGSSFFEFNMQRMSGVIQSVQDINNSKSLYGRTFYMALTYAIISSGGDCNV